MTGLARTRNGVEFPEQRALHGVECSEETARPKLAARHTHHDAILNCKRGAGHRVAFAVVGHLNVPELFARVRIERDEMRIDGREVHGPAEDGYPAIGHAAAQRQSARYLATKGPE